MKVTRVTIALNLDKRIAKIENYQKTKKLVNSKKRMNGQQKKSDKKSDVKNESNSIAI